MKHILSVIQYTTWRAVCFQFTHFSCDDWENIYTLSYYHHQIGSMNYYPLFRVRSWNNGVRCMSFYILMMTQMNPENRCCQDKCSKWSQVVHCVQSNDVRCIHVFKWPNFVSQELLLVTTQWAIMMLQYVVTLKYCDMLHKHLGQYLHL